MVTQQRGH
jgi:hypothetical protein